MPAFYDLSVSSSVEVNANAIFNRRKSISVADGTTPQPVLSSRPDRKLLFFENRSSVAARVKIEDAVSDGEGPAIGTVADYTFSVPANSAGNCPLGVPAGAISVFFETETGGSGELIVTEGW